MVFDRSRTFRGALAGAFAAGVWALQQPLDKRAFASRYDDVELLGRFLTGSRSGWYAPGLALHVGNGALFGAAYAQLAPRLPGPPAARGAAVALVEHVALWPAGRLSDRFHPGRDELPVLTGSRRAFWQAAWRHALFGLLMGELAGRLDAPREPGPETSADLFEQYVSSNGHGDIAHAAIAPEQG